MHSMLQRIESDFKEAINKKRVRVGVRVGVDSSSPISTLSITNTNISEFSSSFSIELGQSGKEITNALKRYQEFEKWMWGECLNLRAMKFGNARCQHVVGICDNCRDLSFFEGSNRCFSCGKICDIFIGSNFAFSKCISEFKEKLKGNSGFYFLNRESGRPVRFRLVKAQLALIEVRERTTTYILLFTFFFFIFIFFINCNSFI